MKIIVLLAFITYIKSQYYSSCIDNPPNGRFGYISSAECRKHNPSDGYCCSLSLFKRNGNHTKKSKYMECIGITKKGYNNISDLVVDFKARKNLTDIDINCTSKILNLFYIYLFLIILYN